MLRTKKIFLRGLAVLFLLASGIKTEASSSVFGTYIGYLKHNRLQRQQIAKLDFVVSREDASKVNLSAVLTLQFGGFESGEYVAYHFDNVEFNILTQQLVFDQSDQSAFLTTSKFGNGELRAQLSSSFVGPVGELVLRQAPLPAPSLPLVDAVSGEYQGSCQDEKPVVMQLNAVRSTEDTFQIGNPFGPYRIAGTVAQFDKELCLDLNDSSRDQACVITDVGASSYNFFSGSLSLIGKRRNFQCKVLPDGKFDCGKCKFERVFSTNGPRNYKPTKAQPFFKVHQTGAALPASGGIAGEYFGYVHHERLNKFQRAKIILNTFQSLNPDGSQDLKLASTANLFFGDYDSPNFTTYRFETIPFPNPILARQFALMRPEADVDAILEITQLGNGTIKGEWQSKMFGRVGTFEMRKSGAPPIPAGAEFIGDFSGLYKAPEWDLNLAISLGRTPINSNNPFDPLKVAGYLRAPIFTGKMPITSSTYDFYTNRMALTYGDDGILVIEPKSNGSLNIRRISNVYGSPLQSFNFENFIQR
jgi:hypothetical protein